jgi:hypothetical protein
MDSLRPFALGPELPADLGPLVLAAAGLEPGAGGALGRRLAQLAGAEVAGVIGYGSRVHGRTGDPGDVDVLVLFDAPVSGGAWGRSGEVDLDLHASSFDDTWLRPEDWLHVADGVVWYDADGRTAIWLDAVRAARRRPPEVPAHVPLRDAVWAGRMLRRIDARRAARPATALLHLATLLAALPEMHAAATREHGTSVPDWVRAIEVERPELAAALYEIASAIDWARLGPGLERAVAAVTGSTPQPRSTSV